MRSRRDAVAGEGGAERHRDKPSGVGRSHLIAFNSSVALSQTPPYFSLPSLELEQRFSVIGVQSFMLPSPAALRFH
jgi:hypothetical protein